MLKATTARSELVRAVARTSHTTTKRGISPFAGTVKISVVSGDVPGLQFYATDGVGFAGTTALADISGTGEVVVPSTHLERILGVLPEGGVLLQENDKSLSISAGKSRRFRIPLLGVSYPPEKDPPEHGSVTLPSSLVLAAIRRVESCREKDGDRPFIQGVLLEAGTSHGVLSACTLSSHRAALTSIPCPPGVLLPVKWSCYLPDRLLRSFYDLAEESKELTISQDTNVYLSTDETLVGCALPGMPFPPHDSAFAELPPRICRVRTPELLGALKAVSAASTDAAITVIFSLAERELCLQSQPDAHDLEDAATASDAVGVVEQYGPLEPFMVAANYIHDVLRTMPAEVDISCSEELVRFDAVPDDKFTGTACAIVMPRK